MHFFEGDIHFRFLNRNKVEVLEGQDRKRSADAASKFLSELKERNAILGWTPLLQTIQNSFEQHGESKVLRFLFADGKISRAYRLITTWLHYCTNALNLFCL